MKDFIVVAIDKYSKSFLCDDGKKCQEQVGDHLIANE